MPGEKEREIQHNSMLGRKKEIRRNFNAREKERGRFSRALMPKRKRFGKASMPWKESGGGI